MSASRAICLFATTLLCALAELQHEDLNRARTKIPGDHVRASHHDAMVYKLNAQLVADPKLRTAPCEQFSLAGLTALQKTLFASREPELQAIYTNTNDNRRLGAVGKLTESLEEMEALWSKEEATLAQQPSLQATARDGRCHEVVMWWVHHLADSTKDELKSLITLPLLAVGGKHTAEVVQQKAPQASHEAVKQVMQSYSQGIGCAACHASGATPENTVAKEWPEELSYNATAYGAFPFWDNTGPGCSWCNPALGDGQQIRVKYSAKLNSEMLMHTSCGNMGWTGASGAPNSSPCNHLFNSKEGAFIYTPKSALDPEADGSFCCRSYKAGDSQFPGAVPKDWMRSMYLYKNQSGGDTVQGFSGDYYSGPLRYYWSSGVVQFWYLETPEGVPVEQGEGCQQPGVKTRTACGYQAPIMLYHDYDPASFLETSHTEEDFAVPDVCKTTTVSCTGPGGDSTSSTPQYPPVLTMHGRMAGVGSN